MQFYITDVFGIGPYTGNQLLTLFDAGELSSEEMQKIAAEINFSETTFVTSRQKRNGGYDVRIFTPRSELPFAGHPTLGTAFLIDTLLENGNTGQIRLNLGVGQIPVTREGDLYWMRQNPPKFGTSITQQKMAAVLGLNNSQIDRRFPVTGVSTGMPFTIVPLVDAEALAQAKLQIPAYAEFLEMTEAKGILVFCPGGHGSSQTLSSRVFVEFEGIPEDPATGSATGCLAAYLLEFDYFGKQDIEIEVGQGYQMGRPSSLFIRARKSDREFVIQVGGRVFRIAEGKWG